MRPQYREQRLAETMHILERRGNVLDADTYIRLIQGCIRMKALAEGRQVHAHLLKRRLKPNSFLWNTLLHMYSKCDSIVEARQVFDKMPQRTVVSWTGIIAAYTRHGQNEEALKLFWKMVQEGVKPNEATFVCTLNACACLGGLNQGKQIHSYIIKNGHESDLFVGNTLLKMYSKCRSLELAQKVFDRMLEKNLVSWSTLITGYAEDEKSEDAVELFKLMQKDGVKPDNVTYAGVLKACATLGAVELGEEVHKLIKSSGFGSDVFVSNNLINMYAKWGRIEDARQIFDQMSHRDIVSWNAIIAAYSQNELVKEVPKIFHKMQCEGVKPNAVTLTMVLNACGSFGNQGMGRGIHSYILEKGFGSDIGLGNTILNMYLNCGAVEAAQQVFDKMPNRDVVSWNALIVGYAQLGQYEKCLKLFESLQERDQRPNEITLTSLLNACAGLSALQHGKQIHEHVVKSGYDSDLFVGSALVDMYAKCGSIEHACDVFYKVPRRDVVSWNAMVAGLERYGGSEEALQLYWKMQQEGMKPSKVTFVSALSACASLGVLEQGKQIHGDIARRGYENDIFVGGAIVDMYAKCGSMDHAAWVFCDMPARDVVPWSAVIAGHARNGHGKKAVEIFQQMLKEGVKPNKVTYIGVLVACSHAGLVDEGQQYFNSMKIDHGITPIADHYACMVDLYGRAGWLEEAEDFILDLPFQASYAVWMSLLGNSRIHGNLELAKRAAESILKLEPHNAAAVVQLSNSYAVAGRWDDKVEVRRLIGG